MMATTTLVTMTMMMMMMLAHYELPAYYVQASGAAAQNRLCRCRWSIDNCRHI